MSDAPPLLFAQAKARYKIADAWRMLGLEGEPKPSCKSPFRDEKTRSFSIFANGTGWRDHGTGEGGDVIDFIRRGIGGNHADVRRWLADRMGVDVDPPAAAKRAPKPPQAPKRIAWPADLIHGTPAEWQVFADHRGLTFEAVHGMAHDGILRFCTLAGVDCYVVTDDAMRAAEIRRMDGQPFNDRKAYPLRGVDKGWLPGSNLLRSTPRSLSVLITEGATDLLAAVDLYSRYRRDHGGRESWQPIALLGATCKTLHDDAAAIIRGRRVRLVPDADPAGDSMAEHWTGLLRKIGCTVDVVDLPRGTDLTDNLQSISPIALFSK